MIRVNWDVEELVALIDLFRKSKDKSTTDIEKELSRLSAALKKRAATLGIVHDEKYRNLNGLKMQYQNLEYIASEGKTGLSSSSKAMKAVYSMMAESPTVFELILEEFNKRYRS